MNHSSVVKHRSAVRVWAPGALGHPAAQDHGRRPDGPQSDRYLVIQRDLALALAGVSSLQEALPLCVDAAVRISGMDCGGIYLVDPATGDLALDYWFGLPQAFVRSVARYPAGSDHAALVMSGKPVYAPYDQVNVSRAEQTMAEGLRAIAIIPILHQDRVVACFNIASHRLATVPAANRDALETVAAQIGNVIARLQAEEALAHNRAFLQNLFDSLGDFLFVLDSDSRILEVNRAVLDRLGYPRDELIGRSVLEVHPPHQRAQAAFVVQEMLAGRLDTCPLALLTRQGGVIPVETKVSAAMWDGRPVLIGLSRDISECQRAEQEIRQALEREKELNDLRTRFISMTSHEFRTPLAAILSSAELIEHYAEKLTPERRQRHLLQIEASAIHLTTMLDEILAINRAESGKLPFEPACLDPVRLCQDAIEEMRLAMRGKRDILFASRWDSGLACIDARLIRSILTNLLSNALKYSAAPAPVQVDLAREAGAAVLVVRDQGIGIPLEDQPRLFEPFFRAQNTRHIPGTGLGLAIVRKAIDLHRGDISFISQPGSGTAFTVRIPA